MRTFALASGSSGNCFYIESREGFKVLVDFGLPLNKTEEILKEKNLSLDEIQAVFITHEHSDHILGLKAFMNKYNCPVYLSKGTLEGLRLDSTKNTILVKNHDSIQLKDLKVFSLKKPHDANEALSFILDDGTKLGVFTDLGHVNDEIKHSLKTLDIIYFEANYCEEFIENNKNKLNSFYLNRLMSDIGHLSLEQCIEALSQTSNNNQIIVLSHISENTNTYENTYSKVKEALSKVNNFPEIIISFQNEASQTIER